MDKPVVRETYLDIIKGVAMLLVVMQHVGGRLDEGMIFLCKVDVPLFFVVSGYLAMKSEINFRQELIKKNKADSTPLHCRSIVCRLLVQPAHCGCHNRHREMWLLVSTMPLFILCHVLRHGKINGKQI